MKKLFKWLGITAGILVALLIVGVIALPFVLPLEKIKEFAVARISETIHREVKIEKASFNLFEGIKLEKLAVSNRPGFSAQPFVSADALSLRYAFWPLFWRQIIIKEVRLVNPNILIEKSAGGEFNFADMTETRARNTEHGTQNTGNTAAGFSLIVDSFSVRNARITYLDHGTKTSSELKNTNLTISGITLALLKPIGFDLSTVAEYQGKEIPLSLSGNIGLDLPGETITLSNFSLGVAGEKAALAAKVSNLKNGLSIDFSLSSGKLSVDPLLAVFTAGASTPKKESARPGELTKTVNQLAATIPGKLKIFGKVNVAELSFLNFKVNKADLSLSLLSKAVGIDIKEISLYDGSLAGQFGIDLNTPGLAYNGKLKLVGFNSAPFSNAMIETFLTRLDNHKDLLNKVSGSLGASLQFAGRGVEVPAIMANLEAAGSLVMKNGELKQLKTIDAIADKIKAPALKRDIKILELSSKFAMKNQIIDLQSFDLKDHSLTLAFKGGVDLGRLKFVAGNRLTIKGSPALTKGIAKEYDLLRDEQGWLEATFELNGDLKRPLPALVLEKPLERAVNKLKITIDAKKVEFDSATEAEKARLVEEAKKKLQEEARKLLKP